MLETDEVLVVRKERGGGGGGALWAWCLGATGGGGDPLLGELSCSELGKAGDCEDPFGRLLVLGAGLKVECKGRLFTGAVLWNEDPAGGAVAGLWTRLESQKSCPKRAREESSCLEPA